MSYTKTTHSTTYSSISPANPALSAKNKIILVIGGGSGIGLEAAHSFAAAGAATVVLAGRRQAILTAAASALRDRIPASSPAAIETYALDVRDPHATTALFERFPAADVVVHAAAVMPTPGALADADPDALWAAFETNTRGVLNVSRGLATAPSSRSHEAVLLVLGTAGVFMPPLTGMGGYIASKAVLPKLVEYLAAENAGRVRVAGVHPGLVRTEAALVLEKHGLVFPYDDGLSLPLFLFVSLPSSSSSPFPSACPPSLVAILSGSHVLSPHPLRGRRIDI